MSFQHSAFQQNAFQVQIPGGGTTASTPWWLWLQEPTPREEVPEPPRASLDAIHRFRTGFQTVGQPVWSLYWKSQIPEIPEFVRPVPLAPTVHSYRWGFQTVGQPAWSLYWRSSVPYIAPPDEGKSYAATVHPYRVGYQTVGQPVWSLYSRGVRPPEADQGLPATPPYLWRQIVTATVTAGQPWLMWPAGARPPVEPEVLYRVDYGKYAMLWGRTVVAPPGLVPHYEINLGLSLSRLGGKF